jgi:7-cyano-7-deazaguanine synthase in queuosine biosynthesis
MRSGVFVSGGLDSAILYHLLIKENPETVPLLVFKNADQQQYAITVINYLQSYHRIQVDPVRLHSSKVKIAISEALAKGFDRVYLGTTKELEEFLVGWEPNNFKNYPQIQGPFSDLDKSQVINIVIQNGMEHLFTITHTCAEQSLGRCGHCNRCRERAWGFSQLGLTDPGNI